MNSSRLEPMQTDSGISSVSSNQGKPKKGHPFLFIAVILASLIVSGALVIGIAAGNADSASAEATGAEEDPGATFSFQRCKVAFQFIWADFKDAVSRRFSKKPPPESIP